MRNHKIVIIEAEGRDKGKTFRIDEMPASVGEQWALDALNGIARSGLIDISDLRDTPMAGLAALGLKAFMGMAKADLQPLLVQMFSCIRFVVPAVPTGRPLIEDDIDEIMTRLKLRQEVFELHTGFSEAVARWNSAAAAAVQAEGASSPNS